MLKNIKSLFILSEEKESNSKTEAQPENLSDNSASPVLSPKGNVDNSILDKLFQALDDNNQQGFDYLEFRKALIALNALSMDEAIKFQSTFATASTMGVTLEKLIESIEFYKKVLINEENNFIKAIKEQTTVNIDEKNSEKEKINLAIKEKSEKIRKLTEEIRGHQSEEQQLRLSIETSEYKINETALNFETSLNIIKKQLEEDATKLKQYIK